MEKRQIRFSDRRSRTFLVELKQFYNTRIKADPILRAHRSEQILFVNGLEKCSRGNDAIIAVEPYLSRLHFHFLLLRSTTLLLRAPFFQSRSSPKGFGSLSLSLSLSLSAFVLLCEKILIQKLVGAGASSSRYRVDLEANTRDGCWKLPSIALSTI